MMLRCNTTLCTLTLKPQHVMILDTNLCKKVCSSTAATSDCKFTIYMMLETSANAMYTCMNQLIHVYYFSAFLVVSCCNTLNKLYRGCLISTEYSLTIFHAQPDSLTNFPHQHTHKHSSSTPDSLTLYLPTPPHKLSS